MSILRIVWLHNHVRNYFIKILNLRKPAVSRRKAAACLAEKTFFSFRGKISGERKIQKNRRKSC